MELHLELKSKITPWKKALILSFLCYIILFCILIAMIAFAGIDNRIILMISSGYMLVLISSFRYMHKKFKEKLVS